MSELDFYKQAVKIIGGMNFRISEGESSIINNACAYAYHHEQELAKAAKTDHEREIHERNAAHFMGVWKRVDECSANWRKRLYAVEARLMAEAKAKKRREAAAKAAATRAARKAVTA